MSSPRLWHILPQYFFLFSINIVLFKRYFFNFLLEKGAVGGVYRQVMLKVCTFLVVGGVVGVRMAWPRIGGCWYNLLAFHGFEFDLLRRSCKSCHCSLSLVVLLPLKSLLLLHTSGVVLITMPFTMEDIFTIPALSICFCCYTKTITETYYSCTFFVLSGGILMQITDRILFEQRWRKTRDKMVHNSFFTFSSTRLGYF